MGNFLEVAMPFTEITIRAAKPRETPYKITDGSGLALLIAPNGSKWWRWRYHRLDGRENMLSLGVWLCAHSHRRIDGACHDDG